MKKILVFLLPCMVFAAFTFLPAKKPLVGHWRAAYGDGSKGTVSFRGDGSYEATFTGYTWKAGGQYKQDGEIFTLTDSVGGIGYWAKYNVAWFSNDSLRFTAIEDTCKGRKSNIHGAVLIRQKM
jgi:hypothetical protein